MCGVKRGRLLDQRLGGVQAGRAGAHHSDPKCPIVRDFCITRAARARNPGFLSNGLGDRPGEVLRGQAQVLQNLGAFAVVKKFLRQAERPRRGVHVVIAQQPTHRVAEAADAPVVFHGHHQPVCARRVHQSLVQVLDRAWVDDRDADALVGQALGGPRGDPGHHPRALISSTPRRPEQAWPARPCRPSADRLDLGADHSLPRVPQNGAGGRSPPRPRSAVAIRVASRGAAIFSPGTTADRAVPHAVVAGAVWAGHPGPVERDRHRQPVQRHVHQQLVEGAVQGTSEIATTGCRPPMARPAVLVIACCSAMPTSKTRSGKARANGPRPADAASPR